MKKTAVPSALGLVTGAHAAPFCLVDGLSCQVLQRVQACVENREVVRVAPTRNFTCEA